MASAALLEVAEDPWVGWFVTKFIFDTHSEGLFYWALGNLP